MTKLKRVNLKREKSKKIKRGEREKERKIGKSKRKKNRKRNRKKMIRLKGKEL